METLDQLSYNILNHLRGGRSTNNEYISLDQIKYNIHHYRSLFLRRDVREDDDLHYFEQEINLDFNEVTSFKDLELSSYLKSKHTLPKLIRLKHRYALTIQQGKDIIPVESYNRKRLSDYNKFTSKKSRAYIKDNYLFISKGLIQKIVKKEKDWYSFDDLSIRGVFDFPPEIMLYNGKLPIDIGNEPYPISGDLSQRITEGLLRGSLPLLLETQADTKLDTIPPNQAEQ